jgi:XTP/dITP diphosphohydrolase
MLYFISSNKNKIARAELFLSPFNISFTPKDLELVEIQSHSIEEIAIDKAKNAFDILKQPLFVNDHGWFITALNGFPGAYMKYVNEWFTPQDFLNLMRGKKNREMIFTETICFTDGTTTKTFSETKIGHVLYKSKGKNIPWMTVSSFSDDDTSIAEKLATSPSAINTSKIYEEFAKWYLESQG